MSTRDLKRPVGRFATTLSFKDKGALFAPPTSVIGALRRPQSMPGQESLFCCQNARKNWFSPNRLLVICSAGAGTFNFLGAGDISVGPWVGAGLGYFPAAGAGAVQNFLGSASLRPYRQAITFRRGLSVNLFPRMCSFCNNYDIIQNHARHCASRPQAAHVVY